ncbi:MAG: dihydroorotase [Gammaproteobacteria bacterium]|nr:dihydroorotase [Gammaproteobacteria bacterium]
MSRLSIINGRLIDPANNIDAPHDIHISDGKIIALGNPPQGFSADRTLDASNKIVCPGLIDLRAAMREPGLEHIATIASETRAAASAGITTLCCPPDTLPIIDTPAVANLIRYQANQAGFARVLPLGALTQSLIGEQISEMVALKEAGCIGVSNALSPITNTLVMRRAMEYAATYDLTVFLHAEDAWLRNDGCVHEGAMSTRYGLPGIPEAAETVAVARDLALIEQTGVRAHFCGLSTGRAVRMIGRAQHDGVNVSADVTAHHLHLSEVDTGKFNSMCHVRPPLRTERDQSSLRMGLKQGIISAICSDHQPHNADAKLAPFSASAHGISALETLLPLSLKLVDELHLLSLSEVIASLTQKPASILGIDAGTLSIGQTADICIFDPEHEWILSENAVQSQGLNSPFLGWDLKGRVFHTLLNGRVVFELE